jgi:GAF domain-containing protein
MTQRRRSEPLTLGANGMSEQRFDPNQLSSWVSQRSAQYTAASITASRYAAMLLFRQLEKCADIHSVLNCVLDRSLELGGTSFGNVQLIDWRSGYLEIKAQRGFQSEFLNFFERVKLDHASACARALRNRDAIVIEDVMADEPFAPCREIVWRAGVRAVLSTPLISTNGAALGVLSVHFPAVHRPTDMQVRGMIEAAGLAANEIIRIRATNGEKMLNAPEVVQKSREAIATAEKLLSRDVLLPAIERDRRTRGEVR